MRLEMSRFRSALHIPYPDSISARAYQDFPVRPKHHCVNISCVSPKCSKFVSACYFPQLYGQVKITARQNFTFCTICDRVHTVSMLLKCLQHHSACSVPKLNVLTTGGQDTPVGIECNGGNIAVIFLAVECLQLTPSRG